MPTDPINVYDFEQIARERMERAAYDYYAGGAGDERTLALNRQALDAVLLRPRVLVDVSHVDTTTDVLGRTVSAPILLAPTAFNKLAHPEGEIAAARAAGAAGTIMTVSTVATCTLEEIAAAATGPLWFQLYIYKDREVTRDLVRRAEAAGYQALVLTVFTPMLGRRERDEKNRFTLPPGISLRNIEVSGKAAGARWENESSFWQYVHALFDPSLSWNTVEWLRSITKLPVVIKGVLTAEDAMRAVGSGAAGIVVSNHGGRQLDGAIATAQALPEIADAAGDDAEIYMDGGVRRGVDVLRALALGARAALIGRAYLWGLASGGEEGVKRVLALLRSELELAMALSGRPTVASVDRALVERS